GTFLRECPFKMNRPRLDDHLGIALREHVAVELRYLLDKGDCRYRRLRQPEQLGEARSISDEDRMLDRIVAADQEPMSPVAFHWRKVERLEQRDGISSPGVAQPVVDRVA